VCIEFLLCDYTERLENLYILLKQPFVHFGDKSMFNLLTPNVNYSGRTAPLTYKVAFLYIYSTNIGSEYFKHGIYSSFFPLKNAVCFIILTYLVPVLFTFYIQGVLKFKKNSGAKRLKLNQCTTQFIFAWAFTVQTRTFFSASRGQ